jgi:hypothetical protein
MAEQPSRWSGLLLSGSGPSQLRVPCRLGPDPEVRRGHDMDWVVGQQVFLAILVPPGVAYCCPRVWGGPRGPLPDPPG